MTESELNHLWAEAIISGHTTISDLIDLLRECQDEITLLTVDNARLEKECDVLQLQVDGVQRALLG